MFKKKKTFFGLLFISLLWDFSPKLYIYLKWVINFLTQIGNLRTLRSITYLQQSCEEFLSPVPLRVTLYKFSLIYNLSISSEVQIITCRNWQSLPGIIALFLWKHKPAKKKNEALLCNLPDNGFLIVVFKSLIASSRFAASWQVCC